MSDLKSDLAALRIEREPERPGIGRWILWTGLLILVAAIGLAAYRWFTRERPVEVQAATVTQRGAGTQAAVLNASGYVVARRRATVSSKITGKVIEVNVEEGMSVREGQVLARLDASTFVAALALAEAQTEAARRAVREIEVDVNESYINRVKPAQPVTAVLDAYPDWQIPAHVITTVPSADRQKATVLVRIAFDSAAARPGAGPEQGRTPPAGAATTRSGP